MLCNVADLTYHEDEDLDKAEFAIGTGWCRRRLQNTPSGTSFTLVIANTLVAWPVCSFHDSQCVEKVTE